MTADLLEGAANQPHRTPSPPRELRKAAGQKQPIAVRFDPHTMEDVRQAAMRSNRSFASAIRLLVEFAIEAQARRISLLPAATSGAPATDRLQQLSIAELHNLRRAVDDEIATRSRHAHESIIRRISELPA